MNKVMETGRKLAKSAAALIPAESSAKRLLRDTMDKGIELGGKGIKLSQRGAVEAKVRTQQAVDRSIALSRRGAAGVEMHAKDAAATARSTAVSALERTARRARDLREHGTNRSAVATAHLSSSVRDTVAGHGKAISNSAIAASKKASATARQVVDRADPQRQVRRLRNWAVGLVTMGAFAFGVGQATPRALADLLVVLKEGSS